MMINNKRIDWFQSLPFIGLHIAAFGVLLVPFRWEWVGLCFAAYVIRMFAITAGYHRYFAHRTYRMGRFAQFVMAVIGTMAFQKGVIWWAANHRHHHKYSDKPEDIHSPLQEGFWMSHVGWFMCADYVATRWELVQDLAKYPELKILNKFYLAPGFMLAGAFFALGGWGALLWGFVLSTVILWHGTFTINSLSHVYGTQRYDSKDTSRNNFWLALITMGEGWHNNHHAYMSSTRQGFFWWEIDMSYYILTALSWVGVTRDLREPPLQLLESKRLTRAEAEEIPSGVLKLRSSDLRKQIATPRREEGPLQSAGPV